ncbi:MAG: FUSC family protein [Actinomycetota bacterium]
MPYTLIVTVLSTVGTFYVLDHPGLYGGAFLIAAIFVLAPIGGAQTLRPTVIRTVATVAGSVFVLTIVSGIESLALVYLVGLVLIVLALMARFGPRGWAYYVFMTPATACLNATSLSQVGSLGDQRVVDNIVGGILVLAASVLAIGCATWATRHGHADDTDPEAERALAAASTA